MAKSRASGGLLGALFNPRDDYDDEERYDNEEFDDDNAEYEEEERIAPAVSGKVRRKANASNLMSLGSENGGMKVVAYKPRDRADAQHIVNCLRDRRPVVMNLTDLDDETARRIFDFVTGAVCALDGGMFKVTGKIFIVAPASVDVICDKDTTGE